MLERPGNFSLAVMQAALGALAQVVVQVGS